MLMELEVRQAQFNGMEVEVYETPMVVHEELALVEREAIVWWAVFVGFSYAVAMAYAAYCTSKGGYPNISFGWRGFKVSCSR